MAERKDCNAHSFQLNSTERCDQLLKLCRGEDDSNVIDDHGSAQKTLSVENSFKRGSLTTRERLKFVMEDLYERLPRLLNDRAKWSNNSMNAYPTTVRLTVRFALDSKRPNGSSTTILKSQQTRCSGQALLNAQYQTQVALLRSMVQPLLDSLVLTLASYNISRINVALTNFRDVSEEVNTKSPISSSMLCTGKSQYIEKSLQAFPDSLSEEYFSEDRKRCLQSISSDCATSSNSRSQVYPYNALQPEMTVKVNEQSRPTKKTHNARSRIDHFFAKKSSR